MPHPGFIELNFQNLPDQLAGSEHWFKNFAMRDTEVDLSAFPLVFAVERISSEVEFAQIAP
jgi:hypothetical protein